MSSSKKQIRIIKSKERESLAQPQTINFEPTSETQLKRQIFETITAWIEEQREAKRELERRAGFLLRTSSDNTVGV